MPASITTLLLLWVALLPPGVKAEPRQSVGTVPVPCRPSSTSLALEAMATIQARPLDPGYTWTISEADTEEEETGDGEDDGLVVPGHWSTLRLDVSGQFSTTRFDRGAIPSPVRSTILRC